MGFKPWQMAIFRFLLIYLLVNVVLVVDLFLFGPFTWANYSLRATVIGVSGIFVALLMTRFGGGHTDDGTFYSADEDAEVKRKSRRGWMYASLFVALALLFTVGIVQMYFI